MAKKKATKKSVAKTPAAKGYKGHRAGSLAEKAHKFVDDNPKLERSKVIAKLKGMGVAENTAAHWLSAFTNWETRSKPKTVSTKKAEAPKKAKVKLRQAKKAPPKKATPKIRPQVPKADAPAAGVKPPEEEKGSAASPAS